MHWIPPSRILPGVRQQTHFTGRFTSQRTVRMCGFADNLENKPLKPTFSSSGFAVIPQDTEGSPRRNSCEKVRACLLVSGPYILWRPHICAVWREDADADAGAGGGWARVWRRWFMPDGAERWGAGGTLDGACAAASRVPAALPPPSCARIPTRCRTHGRGRVSGPHVCVGVRSVRRPRRRRGARARPPAGRGGAAARRHAARAVRRVGGVTF
jgi:hypothetical protein